MSGTPMQNGIVDIYSLIAFLRIRPYSEWKLFHTTFVVGLKKGSERKDGMRQFQALLNAILLRRLKTSKVDGVDIVKDLPEKTIEMVHAVFDQEQLEFYRALESGAITQMKKYQAEGTLGKNMANAFVMLLRLRQACLHPMLIKAIKKVGSTEEPALAKDVDDKIASNLREILNFECPVCLKTAIELSPVMPCGHHVLNPARWC
jgi:SNF2 family DNA or RNA helicase